MAKRDSPSVGALFFEALGHFCLDVLAMVLCLFAGVYEGVKWLFNFVFRGRR